MITTGERWPCNEGRAPVGNVIILNAEDLPPVREPDDVVFRREAHGACLDPGDPLGDQLLLAPFRLLSAEDARADERPARLVGMALRRIWLPSTSFT